MNDSYHIEELEIRISNYLSGNCTEEEKEALFAYLASNEDAAKIFREMSAVWAVSSVPAFAKVEDANLSQIKEKIAAAEDETCPFAEDSSCVAEGSCCNYFVVGL